MDCLVIPAQAGIQGVRHRPACCARGLDALGPRLRGGDGYLPVTAPVFPLVIAPDSVRTLGGLVAFAAGECASDVSSGFCSGGA